MRYINKIQGLSRDTVYRLDKTRLEVDSPTVKVIAAPLLVTIRTMHFILVEVVSTVSCVRR